MATEETPAAVVEKTTPATPPVATTQPVAAPAAKPEEKPVPIKAPETVKEKPTDPAVVAPVVEADPVVEVPVESVDDPVDDDEQVTALKIQLAAFAKLVGRPGKSPEDFKSAAKTAVQFTQFVIKYPKVPVLDALLAFFEENIDGACNPKNYMKGSTTLSRTDEQQVGFLYGLFSDLARKQSVKINSGLVVQILKKPEIVGYYNRRISGLVQSN